MTRTVGHVQITNNGLAAKCEKCRKSLAYPIGSRIPLDAFNAQLREFTAKHRECGQKDTEEQSA